MTTVEEANFDQAESQLLEAEAARVEQEEHFEPGVGAVSKMGTDTSEAELDEIMSVTRAAAEAQAELEESGQNPLEESDEDGTDEGDEYELEEERPNRARQEEPERKYYS